ncbi:MAG TPA: hypothetical protein VG389_07145 [Myxococcota bacterium]|nr:hypothetical protein [Myxococcota bacterium]
MPVIDPIDPHGPLRHSFWRVVEDPTQVLRVTLRREDVRALELGAALAPVHVAHEEELVPRAEAILQYVFVGYERDPRPMHEIGEVQRFARALDTEAPALLFFLDREQRSAFARCAAPPDEGAASTAEAAARGAAAAWRARKRDAVLGLGAAYGFDGAPAWRRIAADVGWVEGAS